MKLRVLDNCDGCGACCMEQSSPPGYVYLLQLDEAARSAWPDQGDIQRIANMPAHVRQELVNYLELLQAGILRRHGEEPCLWLNQRTKQCRHYELRPSVCRDFERGSSGCREWREQFHVEDPR